MRRRPAIAILAAVVMIGGGGTASATPGLPVDTTPPYPLEAPGAPWSHPFSLVAGGGLHRPADGMIAGDADLETVWAAARGGDGRVILSTSTGLWAVGSDGRLQAITGVPAVGDNRAQVVALADGSVVIEPMPSESSTAGAPIPFAGDYALAPGARAATPGPAPGPRMELIGIGVDGQGALTAISGGRFLRTSAQGFVATGPRLWKDDGITEARGTAGARDGLLVASLLPNNETAGDPGGDRSTLYATDGSRVRSLLRPPSNQSLRSLAPAGDEAIMAANASTLGELDDRPLELAAGPKLDRQLFSYGVGEEYYGWIARRRVLVRTAAGKIERARWDGPPADAIQPDGDAGDVLVASGGRAWTTRPGLRAPDVRGLWQRRVGVTLDTPATVTVTTADSAGNVLATAGPRPEAAGTTTISLGALPHDRLVRIVVTATTPTTVRTTAAWAFAGPGELSVTTGRRVLRAIGRRLNVGFESDVAHGVDRCRGTASTIVTCRWLTGGTEAPHTARRATVRLTPAGYVVTSGRPHAAHVRGIALLGAPYDAST